MKYLTFTFFFNNSYQKAQIEVKDSKQAKSIIKDILEKRGHENISYTQIQNDFKLITVKGDSTESKDIVIK